MTADQSNRIALAENLVDSARFRLLRAEARAAHAEGGYLGELMAAEFGLAAACQRSQDTESRALRC